MVDNLEILNIRLDRLKQIYKLIDINKITDFLNNNPNYEPIRNTNDKFLVKKITKSTEIISKVIS